MPFRVRLKFKPEQLGTIQQFFKQEHENYERSLKRMRKPIGRLQRFLLETHVKMALKKNKLDASKAKEKVDVILNKYSNGYLFETDFIGTQEAIMTWKDFIVLDYKTLEEEFVVRGLFPLISMKGTISDIMKGLRFGNLKKEIQKSMFDAMPPAARIKETTLNEIKQILGEDVAVFIEW